MTEIKDVDRASCGQIFEALDAEAMTTQYVQMCFAAHREAAEKAERDKIVAWIRDGKGPYVEGYGDNIADAIEDGDYLK